MPRYAQNPVTAMKIIRLPVWMSNHSGKVMRQATTSHHERRRGRTATWRTCHSHSGMSVTKPRIHAATGDQRNA